MSTAVLAPMSKRGSLAEKKYGIVRPFAKEGVIMHRRRNGRNGRILLRGVILIFISQKVRPYNNQLHFAQSVMVEEH